MTIAASRAWCLLVPSLLLACTTTTADPSRGSSANPPGTSGEAGTTTNTTGTAADILLAVVADDTTTTAGVYDGKTWKMHPFAGEPAGWPAPKVALAPDGTGLIVKGTGYRKPLRFARYLGGDKWSAFSDVPESEVDGNGFIEDEGAPVSVAYRNGVFVLGYNAAGFRPVLRTFDPAKGAFGPIVELSSGTMKCETPEGAKRDCAMASGIRFGSSAAGPDEVFAVFDGGLGGFFTSFKPIASGMPSPTLKAADPDVGTDLVPDSAPMTNAGETLAVQILFGIHDRFGERLNFVGEQVPAGDAGYCYKYFKVLGAKASSDVSILCRGMRWYWGNDSWEHVLEGHLAGNVMTWKTVPTSLPILGSFEYLRGLGSDKPYVVGIMDGGDVGLFKDMNASPEVFAHGKMLGAAVTPR